MSKLVLSCAVALSLILLSTAAWAAPGDVVPGDAAIVTNTPAPVAPDVPGDPTLGNYSALVTAYIASYARVTVYDNFIDFGPLSETSGTYASPVAKIADVNANAPGALNTVPGATAADIAGGRIDTNCRLNMKVDLGGHLTRVTETGAAFAGKDTRRADGATTGKYQLATQYKMNLHGRYLVYGDGAWDATADETPAEDTGSRFTSPSGIQTDYNTWSKWGATSDTIAGEDGWVWPANTGTTAWDGEAYGGSAGAETADSIPGAFPKVQETLAIVERGQAQTTGRGLGATHVGDAAAAEWWIASRVWRRGLQDVSGNYKGTITVNLHYRETPGDWNPAS